MLLPHPCTMKVIRVSMRNGGEFGEDTGGVLPPVISKFESLWFVDTIEAATGSQNLSPGKQPNNGRRRKNEQETGKHQFTMLAFLIHKHNVKQYHSGIDDDDVAQGRKKRKQEFRMRVDRVRGKLNVLEWRDDCRFVECKPSQR